MVKLKYFIERKVLTTSFKTCELNSLLGLSMTDEDVKVELGRLDFDYTYDKEVFNVTIPKRRLDVEAHVNDIAEDYQEADSRSSHRVYRPMYSQETRRFGVWNGRQCTYL